MSDQSPLGTFLKEMGAHDLLTFQEEKTLFNDIDEIRGDIIHEINRTAILFSKIPSINNAIISGDDDLKSFIATYKHDLKMAQLLPFCKSKMKEYCDAYEERVAMDDDDYVYNLDMIMEELMFEDSFIEECVYDILNSPIETAETHMLVSKEDLEEIQYTLGASIRDFKSKKNKVIECNLRLVVAQAKKYHNTQSHHTFLDLIQEGTFGLIKAVDRFNVDSGNKFSTLATWWVRQSIIRSLQNNGRTIRVPVAVQDLLSKVTKFQDLFFEKHSKLPTEREIAKELGISVPRVQEVLASSTSISSITAPVGEDGEMTLGDIIPDSEQTSAFDEISTSQIKETVRNALDCLDDNERTLMEIRFGLDSDDPKSLSEIASMLDTTKTTIQRFESKVIDKLKKFL